MITPAVYSTSLSYKPALRNISQPQFGATPTNRSRRAFLASPLLALLPSVPIQALQPLSEVPKVRLATLRTGVNLNAWFANFSGGKFVPDRIKSADLERIKALGFAHVRLPIEPLLFFNEKNPTEIHPENLKALDNTVNLILKTGLGVILDMHSYKDEFKNSIARNADYGTKFTTFWTPFARHFAEGPYAKQADKIFFETLNEPGFEWKGSSSAKWTQLQEKIVAAIRQGAPQNTIIVKSDLEEVRTDIQPNRMLKNLADKNLVYSTHYYDPMAFTHQGADWQTEEKYNKLEKISYPLTPKDVTDLIKKLTDLGAVGYAVNALRPYQASGFGPKQIEESFANIAKQAKANGYPVYLGEFGVLRGKVKDEDRNRWLADVRSAAEKYGFGWSLWEYNHIFGLMNSRGQLDTETVNALLPKQK
jgi:aryl-phospho-beta-D-glucosidase BglC (GH1 family)